MKGVEEKLSLVARERSEAVSRLQEAQEREARAEAEAAGARKAEADATAEIAVRAM